MYVPFQKRNSFGIVPFQANMQFNSHSFDSISCQFVIPLQFTLKVENSRIIPILKFQFQCPVLYIHMYMYIYIHTYIRVHVHTYNVLMYMYVYIHTCTTVNTYIHVHTYIYEYDCFRHFSLVN